MYPAKDFSIHQRDYARNPRAPSVGSGTIADLQVFLRVQSLKCWAFLSLHVALGIPDTFYCTTTIKMHQLSLLGIEAGKVNLGASGLLSSYCALLEVRQRMC